jgi:hypothetical protein
MTKPPPCPWDGSATSRLADLGWLNPRSDQMEVVEPPQGSCEWFRPLPLAKMGWPATFFNLIFIIF